jgi:hypothetical protein
MRISNDFGIRNPDVRPWLLNGGKGMVELRTCSIDVKELRKTVEWRTREHMEEWLTKPSFWLSKVEVQIRKDALGWYLMLVGTKDSIIIVHTRCHYGGCREWFECPECKGRRSTLYRDHGKFKCRGCLDLVYYTQKMNYRGLEPILRRMKKCEEMQDTQKNLVRLYKGNPTKRMERYQKLSYQVGVETRLLAPRLNQTK